MNATEYNADVHMDLVDEHNEGVSHFGIHPNKLPRSNVRFDMFHMKCAVTRNLMNYIRFLIQKQCKPLRDSFTENVLRGISSTNFIFSVGTITLRFQS